MKHLVAHADCISNAIQMITIFNAAGLKNQFEIKFLTENFFVKRKLNGLGYKCVDLSIHTKNFSITAEERQNFERLFYTSRCYYLGELNIKFARTLYTSLRITLSNNNYDVFWTTGGTKFIDRVLMEISSKFDIPMKVFERANVPGYFILDDDGANCEGRYFKRKNQYRTLLKKEQKALSDWKINYKKSKDQVRAIPQSRLSFEEILPKALTFFQISRRRWKHYPLITDQVLGYLLKKPLLTMALFLFPRKITSDFIYFPQQVSKDAQILLHSKYDNLSALNKIAIDNPHISIVTNFHPAEHKISAYIKIIPFLIQHKNVVLSQRRSWDLTKNAQKVITISSTVGFEAIILDKDVSFLSPTNYAFLIGNQFEQHKYIFSYLLKSDLILESKNILIEERLTKKTSW